MIKIVGESRAMSTVRRTRSPIGDRAFDSVSAFRVVVDSIVSATSRRNHILIACSIVKRFLTITNDFQHIMSTSHISCTLTVYNVALM